MYLDAHGADDHAKYFMAIPDINFSNDNMFSLWYLCGEKNDTACKLIINEFIANEDWERLLVVMTDFIDTVCGNDYTKVTEYEINALARAHIQMDTASELGKAFDKINDWRIAHGMEPFESIEVFLKNFHPVFDTFVIASGDYHYSKSDDIEPQNVMCKSITSDYKYCIETRKYNTIYEIEVNGERIQPDDRTTKYVLNVKFLDETKPQTHFIIYATEYDYKWAIDELPSDLKQAYDAIQNLYFAFAMQLENMSYSIVFDRNINNLHEPVAVLERAVKRLGDAVREFGGR